MRSLFRSHPLAAGLLIIFLIIAIKIAMIGKKYNMNGLAANIRGFGAPFRNFGERLRMKGLRFLIVISRDFETFFKTED